MKCHFCKTPLEHIFADLHFAPPSNAYLGADDLDRPETFYPLQAFVCHECQLVQVPEQKQHQEIFNQGYAYFASYSSSWLEHARAYVQMITQRLGLYPGSQVLEVASNDGYLLQFFRERGIPCLGVDPAGNAARVAETRGIETLVEFFGLDLARRLARSRSLADLVICNNILAHVPGINDFLAGLKTILAPQGVITAEFPHLLRLIEQSQFDTIYHEHFSYLSLRTTRRIFAAHGLAIFDVQELPTHGGSLRIFAEHADSPSRSTSARVKRIIAREEAWGLSRLPLDPEFQVRIDRIKDDLLSFLIQEKNRGHKVLAYGAAAKGNTLLNYCGIKRDLIEFVADRSPFKQGLYLPGSHIPILGEEWITKKRPDFVLVLPWNLLEEIRHQLDGIRDWGGRFVTAIPRLTVW